MFTVFQLGVYTGIHSLPRVHLEEGKNWQNIIALTAADTSGARKKHKNVQACYSTQISNSDGGVRVGDIESELSRIESGVET